MRVQFPFKNIQRGWGTNCDGTPIRKHSAQMGAKKTKM